jgi:hypothetical protein
LVTLDLAVQQIAAKAKSAVVSSFPRYRRQTWPSSNKNWASSYRETIALVFFKSHGGAKSIPAVPVHQVMGLGG